MRKTRWFSGGAAAVALASVVMSSAGCGGGGGTSSSDTRPVVAGTVSLAGGGALSGVLVRVVGLADQQLVGSARTDAAGRYAIPVDGGVQVVVQALNDGTTSGAASAWWTAGGGVAQRTLADPVPVGTGAITRDFVLQPGARVIGTVTAEAGGAALAGVRVQVKTLVNGSVVAATPTGAGGGFSINLLPGSYYLEFGNDGSQPYASELYNPSTNGANNRLRAQRLDLAAGDVLTADASLLAGRLLQGTVSSLGLPLVGVTVRVTDATTGTAVSFSRVTGPDGGYRVWVRSGSYYVRARGQVATVNLSTADQTQSFSGNMGVITASLRDHGGSPARGLFGYVYDAAHLSMGTQSWEGSNPDGSLAVFVPTGVTSAVLEIRSDGQPVGTTIYSGATRLASGTSIAAPATGAATALGAVTLPAGGVLTGTVTRNGVPAAALRVQVRSGGTGDADAFTTVRTRDDGAFTVSLPPGTYDRVCAWDSGSSCGATPVGATWAYQDAVVVTSGATAVVNLSYP